MTARRSLARAWRRLRRPTFGRLIVGSVVVHLAVMTLALWFTGGGVVPVRRPPPESPLIVELPPAAPGTPLVRPEAPSRGRPAPPAVATRPVPAPPPARAPVTPPSEAARRPEPPPEVPEPAPAAPLPVPPPPPSPPPVAAPPPSVPPPPSPEPPAPPAVATPTPPPEPAPAERGAVTAARPPEPAPPAPSVPPPGAAGGARPGGGGESPLAGRGFSLLTPRLEVPSLPGDGEASGSGGTRREGTGTGEAGTEREGGPAVPLNTADPRYADYFLEIKRRIEAHLVYPREAARQGQSGQLLLEFVVRKDGSIRLVELVRSSGVGILDRYSLNTVKLAAPFPPIPDRLGVDIVVISANFTYVLDRGFRYGGILR